MFFNCSYSYHNVTVNYAKWQLLYNEFNNFRAALSNDGIKKIHRTDFPVVETASQACVQTVEKFMPLAVARPFVEEFISAKVIDQVNN